MPELGDALLIPITFLFFLLALFWPMLVIWVFDFYYGFKNTLSGIALFISWLLIHLILSVSSLSWSYRLNQQPSLNLENITLSLTEFCRIRIMYECVYGIDYIRLLMIIALSTIPGLVFFYLGIKFRRY